MAIKKIAVRGGHNFEARGAKGILDETVEDRKVYQAVIKYLRSLGYEVLDVTPGNCDVNADLTYGVNKAESWGADLFISIHFDKAYDSYDGALGTGTWIYGYGGEAEVIATRIVDNVADKTGFRNRGVKVNSRLYELRKTTMPAVIVETCFCEAKKDAEIYNKVGADKIGAYIAEGIANKNVTITSTPSNGSNESNSNSSSSSSAYEGFYESNESRTNATIVGEGDIDVLDKKGNKIPNRYISSLDKVFVLGIYPSMKYIELIYPSGSKKYHAYMPISAYNRVSFEYHKGYKNDGGETYVWWNSSDVNKKEHNEVLQPNQVASPMYRENGWLRITFYRKDGTPSDGFVRYEGAQSQNFYKCNPTVTQDVNVHNSASESSSVIGKVFKGEEVVIKWTEPGWHYIQYNTSNGKKEGYVPAKYIN